MKYNKDLSIVISLYNEAESLPELISWIERVAAEQKYEYEIIMVDDGSTDGSWQIIKEMSDNSVEITVSQQHCSTASMQPKEESSSRWMLTFRILLTKYRSCTEWSLRMDGTLCQDGKNRGSTTNLQRIFHRNCTMQRQERSQAYSFTT